MARARRRARDTDLTDGEWAFLNDRPMPVCPEAWSLRFDGGVAFRAGRPTAEQLWKRYGRDVLREWTALHPGTRPSLWWRYERPGPRDPRESEAAYLDRHGLLAPAERARLRKSDFAPVAANAVGRAA